MTTEAEIVPNEAINVTFDRMSANVRLIDCVGYVVDDALGQKEGGKSRLVKTPWHDEEVTFQQAAEIGTAKVIKDHSTVGILLTTDGSITEIGRDKYVAAEERVVSELKQYGKPFCIVLNSRNPGGKEAKNLKQNLENKYKVPVILCVCAQPHQGHAV
jgi:stage IV sporulation protein A